MAIEQRVVEPELAIFLSIICLHHSRQAKQPVNEALFTGHLSASGSATFFCRVDVVLHNRLSSSPECSCCVHTDPGEPHD